MFSSDHPLALIGCGNIGQALARGWCASCLPTSSLITVDRNAPKRERFYHDISCQTVSSLNALVHASPPAALCLAVKPHQLEELLAEIRVIFAGRMPLIVSVVAGKSIDWIASHLEAQTAIIRLMPNTPTQLGVGMCGALGNANVSALQRDEIDRLMRSVGKILWLKDEAHMHALTAISGSGPAYVFYLMECFMLAAKNLGFTEEEARLLVSQTFLGAAHMATALPQPIDALRQSVTSPNGTTQAALEVLMGGALESIIERTVTSAKSRSESMSAE